MNSDDQDKHFVPSKDTSSDSGYSIWWIILGIGLIIALIILFVIWFSRGKSDNDTILINVNDERQSLPLATGTGTGKPLPSTTRETLPTAGAETYTSSTTGPRLASALGPGSNVVDTSGLNTASNTAPINQIGSTGLNGATFSTPANPGRVPVETSWLPSVEMNY